METLQKGHIYHGMFCNIGKSRKDFKEATGQTGLNIKSVFQKIHSKGNSFDPLQNRPH